MHAILGIVNAIQANMNQGRLYYTLLVCSLTSKKLLTPLNIIFCWINSLSRQLPCLWWINQTMIFLIPQEQHRSQGSLLPVPAGRKENLGTRLISIIALKLLTLPIASPNKAAIGSSSFLFSKVAN